MPITQGPISVGLQTVASGLVSPGLLISAPDGTDRQFILDQPGQVRLIENGTVLGTSFLDVSARLSPLNPGYDERGLLGMAFDPGFATPASPGYRRIFTYTSEPVASGTPDYTNPHATPGTALHHSVVASWTVDPLNANRIEPTSRNEILRFEQPQNNHNGGALNFGPDGHLYIGDGDGGASNDNGTGRRISTATW